MKRKNTIHMKQKLAVTIMALFFSVYMNFKSDIMVSAKEVPDGYTLVYGAKEAIGNDSTDDEDSWMDVDGSHLQITPVSEVPEGYTPIRSIDDLYGINDDPSGNYILMDDIDLSQTAPGGEWDFGNGWKPIEEFYGTLDGNGYRIMNMIIYGTSDEDESFGLIKNLIAGGTVINLGMTNINIDITGRSGNLNIGGIAAKTDKGPFWMPEISRCFVTGTITIRNGEVASVGGIAGEGRCLTVQDCYADVDIDTKGGSYAGGIVGRSGYMDGYGDIRRCYTVGKISGSCEYVNMVGGSYCTNCYYLKTNGKDAFSEGLSQSQMEKEKCYTGFDFGKVWYMDSVSGYDYPQLRNCPQARVSSCELTTLPEKLDYTMTEIKKGKLDLSGGLLTLTYEDGVKVPVELESNMISEIYRKENDKQAPIKVFLNYVNAETSFDITEIEILATSLKLDRSKCGLKRGESIRITGSIVPANAVNDKLTWKTDNELVATVSGNGIIKGLNAGTAKITASTDNGITASCTVTVNVPAKKIKLNVSNLILKKGQKKKVTAVMTPLDATDTITWISSNPKIVKVNNTGSIIAKKQGAAVVMAKTSSGKRAYIKISVK